MAVRSRIDDALWSTAGVIETQQPADALSAYGWRLGRSPFSYAWLTGSCEFGRDYGQNWVAGISPHTASPGLAIIGLGQADWESDPRGVGSYPLPIFVYDEPSAVMTLGARGGRAATRPTWISPVLRRLDGILSLPAGWDGRDARRPHPWHAVEAYAFMQHLMQDETALPSIVPLADGGVQIEWHRGGLDVEATFTAGPDRGLYFMDLPTGDEFEGPIEEGIGDLRRLMARLEEADTATVHAAD